MIAPMEKLVVAGPKRVAQDILRELQRVAVVHLDPLADEELMQYRLSRAEEDQLRRWDHLSASAEFTLHQLGLGHDRFVKSFDGPLEEAETRLGPWMHRADVLDGEREALRQELAVIDQYLNISTAFAGMTYGLDGSRWLMVLPFVSEEAEVLGLLRETLEQELGDRFVLATKAVDKRTAVVVVVRRKEADQARGLLARHGLAELPKPAAYEGLDLKETAETMARRIRLAPEELTGVEEGLNRLREEASSGLVSIWIRAKDEAARLTAMRDMAAGRYGFALFGWVPVKLKGRVEEGLARFRDEVVYTFEPADEHHEAVKVPVTLDNPSWARPFELLISFLNTPRYGSYDPTWVIASFFPFWFGMVVGDMGYGLLFVMLARFLAGFVRRGEPLVVDFFGMRLAPETVEQVVRILNPMIFWTFVFGFLYGEFFGNLLEHLGLFGGGGYSGFIPILIPRTDTATTANSLILVTIVFGILQVLHGFYIKAAQAVKHGDRTHFWEAAGYLGGVSALVLFAYAFMTGGYPVWLLVPILMGAVLFVLGAVLAKMPLMVAELPTQGGHILSYIRIYAVGLASAILANLATDLGFSLGRHLGLLGLAVGLLVGLLVHGLLVILLTLGHVLQPIRLIWVEFFTKFDFYTISGRRYRPFKSVRG